MDLASVVPYLERFGGVILCFMTLVQIAPIKINPWSWIAKKLGNALNHDMIEKVNDLDAKLTAHIKESELIEMAECRQRILDFSGEILRGKRHTEEEFNGILGLIDKYEKYCIDHPDYPNSKAVLSI